MTSLKLALPLEHVIRVVPVLLCKPLPGAPESVQGIVDLQGEIIPLIDLYLVLGINRPETTELWESLILVQTSKRKLLLPATQVIDVYDRNTDAESASDTFVPADDPHIDSTKIKGILQYAGDLLLVQDIEALLTHKDEESVRHAIDAFRKRTLDKASKKS